MNVIGEPYYKAVKILHGMGLKTTFGGSVGSDLPQAQCMVTSQKMLSNGKMQMNLDCTEEAAQQMAEQGSLGSGGAPGAGRRQYVEAANRSRSPRVERRRSHVACARAATCRLGLGQASQVLQRLRHGPADLTRRHPVGDQAEHATRRLRRPAGTSPGCGRRRRRAAGTGHAA